MPKDACYHKVKSRYKVFPSAYASGAIAACRKKGAKNWGNSSKKADGGIMDKQAVIKASNGTAYRKRKAKDPRIARGCGGVLNERRKKTKIT